MTIRADAVDCEHLHEMQSQLRNSLLNGRRLGSAERQLAAEMLLYLDDAGRCWSVCAEWMLDNSFAERVDGAFSKPRDRVYTAQYERRRDDVDMPTVIGVNFDAREQGIRTVWQSQHAVAYQKAAEDGRLSPSLRAALASVGIRSKLAVALRDRGQEVGLLCLDSSREEAWSSGSCEMVGHLAREVIGPVLGAALELSGSAGFMASTGANKTTHLTSFALTPAELRVAELVVAGLSYKEIARKLDRSCATIDHQLRSIRDKFGVTSTAKLVHALTSQLASPFAGASRSARVPGR